MIRDKEIFVTEIDRSTKQCSQCRFNNTAAAKFCSECGEIAPELEGDDENDVRLFAESNSSTPDMSFFNSISECLQEDRSGHAASDDNARRKTFAARSKATHRRPPAIRDQCDRRPAADEQPVDGVAAEKSRAAETYQRALSRLSAAREEAFRKLLEDPEEIPKKLPRLLTQRVSKLMATPATKMDLINQQILELGTTNSPACSRH